MHTLNRSLDPLSSATTFAHSLLVQLAASLYVIFYFTASQIYCISSYLVFFYFLLLIYLLFFFLFLLLRLSCGCTKTNVYRRCQQFRCCCCCCICSGSSSSTRAVTVTSLWKCSEIEVTWESVPFHISSFYLFSALALANGSEKVKLLTTKWPGGTELYECCNLEQLNSRKMLFNDTSGKKKGR